MGIKDNASNKERFPGSNVALGALVMDGAVVGEMCRIDDGCQISANAVIDQNVVLCQNVQILGEVHIDNGCNIRENVTLVGPLHIGQGVYIGRDSIIGATREEADLAVKETLIHENCRIGKAVEIIGGVNVGEFSRIRTNAKVIGDVPQYAIVSRSPAILERFGCPNCGGQLLIKQKAQDLLFLACTQCDQTEIKFSATEWVRIPNHVLLPENRQGEEYISTKGDDHRWLEEWEVR